jgi:16S rRNA (cytosine967-C5)-methyltransferase
MQNKGAIVACDVRRNALANLTERAIRAGATIITTKLANELKPSEQFDIVLVDAPCSGTGTWRRQPELRWRLPPSRLDELNTVQDALLSQAAAHVTPGGRLVYATCSILPRENEDRFTALLNRNPAFTPRAAAEIWRASGASATPPGMDTIFAATPHRTGTDGFFTAIAVR